MIIVTILGSKNTDFLVEWFLEIVQILKKFERKNTRKIHFFEIKIDVNAIIVLR